MLKRIEGSRSIGLEDIPLLMDELDDLEDIYFGMREPKNQAAARKAKGLYEYAYLLNPPKEPSIHVPYNLLATMIRYAPSEMTERFVLQKIGEYGYFPEDIDWKTTIAEQDLQELPTIFQKIRSRIKLAKNWVEETTSDEEKSVELSLEQRKAINDLIPRLIGISTADAYQAAIFSVCKENKLPPRKLFPILYQIFIGINRGPKLGPLLALMGPEEVIEKLEMALG